MDAHSWPANVVDLLLDAVVVVDLTGSIVQISAASERIFGYTPLEMIGRAMIDFVYAEDRPKTIAEAKLVIDGVPRSGFENRYIRKDGRLVHIMWSAMLSRTDKLRIGVARDVTESKLARARQAATYAISESLHASADLASVFDEVARIVAEIIPIGGFQVSIADSGNAPVSQNAEFKAELPLMHAGRQLGLLQVGKATAFSPEDLEFLTFIAGQIALAIERKMLHDDLLRAARYDELTGLPNRRLFNDRLRSAMARVRRKGTMLALLYLDVDDFKAVNDTLGHAAGDAVLSQLAQRLRGCVRESDTVARFGGDEFLVLIEDLQSPAAARAVAEKIGAALEAEIALSESMALVGGVSIGMAFYPGDGEDENALLACADRKMYLVKHTRSQ